MKKIQFLTLLTVSMLMTGCTQHSAKDNLWPAPISSKAAAQYDQEMSISETVVFNTWENHPIFGDESSFLYLVDTQSEEIIPIIQPVANLQPGTYRVYIYCHNTAKLRDDETDIARRVTIELGYPIRMTQGEQGSITATISGFANGSAIEQCTDTLSITAEADIVLNLAAGQDPETMEIIPHLLVGTLAGKNVCDGVSYSLSFNNDQVTAEILLGDIPAGLMESRVVIYELEISQQPPTDGVG